MTADDEMLRMIGIEARLGMDAQALGRDANTLVQSLRDLPATLLEAFIGTNYLVTLYSDTHVLNVSKTMPDALTRSLETLAAQSISIITAWNPYSAIATSNEDNIKRQSLLENVLNVRGDRWFHAKGTSADGKWSEESFAVLDLSAELAAAIGYVFQQHAIVYCERGNIVELVPCPPSTPDSDDKNDLARGVEKQAGFATGTQGEIVRKRRPVPRTPSANHGGGWSWNSLPDDIKRRFSPPPERSKFTSTEDYEEARGYWQGRVGRNIGLVLQQHRPRTDQKSTTYCLKCSKSILDSWQGWPHKDAVPLLPLQVSGTCENCKAEAQALVSSQITWFNYHSEDNTGLPDYWLLQIDGDRTKWGSPYHSEGICPVCSNRSIISQMKCPNGKVEFKNNCLECGVKNAH